VRAENPAALRFILQDDIYLLPGDKALAAAAPEHPIADILPEPVAIPRAETVAERPQPVVIPKIEPVTASVSKPAEQTAATQLNYLGGNKKAFLIITHYTNHEFIADSHLTALQSILKRKEHELADVAIFNIAKSQPPTLRELLNYFKPKKLLILGKQSLPEKLEMLPLNEIKQAKEYAVLHTFNFDDMMDSTENKKAFWDQMKNL
jgi:hypothetical protein